MESVFQERFQTAVENLLKFDISEREQKIAEVCDGDKTLEDTVRTHLHLTSQLNALDPEQTMAQEGLEQTMTQAGTPSKMTTTRTAPFTNAPKVFGHYEIKSQIGIGGMGVVYKAVDQHLEREVALKLLSPLYSMDDNARKRFLSEAKAISKLDHPNVCTIFDMGETPDKQLFFAMPLYEGEELSDLLKKDKIQLGQAIDVLTQVCKGIAAAHSKEIIHRDIKPANVFVTNDGIAKVLDFGIAKSIGVELTQTGQTVGTILYMSPEQVDSEELNHRTDIWSMGVMFYEMLTGKRPFTGKTALAISQKIVQCQPEPIETHTDKLPAIAKRILAKTLNVVQANRYESLHEMAEDLKILQRELEAQNIQGKVVERQTDTGSQDTNLFLSGTLSEINKTLEPYLGTSSRIIINSLSSKCESLEELKKKLAMEVPIEHRSDFLKKVKHIGSSKKSIALFPVLLVLIIAVLAGIIVGGGSEPQETANVTALISNEQVVDVHKDVRGVTKNTVTIGMTAAFSGPARELGRNMKVGLETCFKEINDAGGIHGRQLVLKAMDDSYEPDKAVANLETLLNDKEGIFAFTGNVGTPTAKAILPQVLEDGVVLFGTFSGAQLLRRVPPDRNVFNYRASYAEEVEAIVKYYAEVEGVKPHRIAVFYQNDSYGLDVLKAIKAAVQRRNTSEIRYVANYKRNTVKVDKAVETFLSVKENIGAIIVIGTYKASAAFTKKMKDGGYKGKFANVSFVGTKALIEEFKGLGSEYAEDVIISQVVPYYQSYSECAIKYRKAQKKYFPTEDFNFISLEGYLAGHILVEALRKNGRLLNNETFTEALKSIKDLDLGTGQEFSFGKSRHQASHFVWGIKLTNEAEIEEVQFADPH
ncbi:MAG: ABC transporter substrate-binding protein [Lentisphaerales bacterium]|nr:ABC transporter substrate-binding protein [Lentisphaerales bacterium]